MNYLLLGCDSLAKDKKINELKSKFLKSEDSFKFDLDTLHSNKLNSDNLKKSLISLPAVSKQRIVVLKSIEKLSPHNKDIVLDFLERSEESVVLILEGNESIAKNSFVSKAKKYVEVLTFGKTQNQNVFDMTKAMSQRNPQESLRILKDLLAQGDHPLQIMGGLVWFWGKTKNRLNSERFKKGLLVLQEADLNIKRSRIKSEYAVELVVVKLCSLLAY